MKINRIKIIAIMIFAVSILLLFVFKNAPARDLVSANSEDPAATYKAKCAACHLPNASKFYDPAKPDEEHIQIILKGKKGEKPPYMPGFEAKGMTEVEAKTLAEYMKGLRKAS